MGLNGATAYADAVIVAAGSSRRMGGVDKLEAAILGRPLLAWAVDSIASAGSVRRLVVVAAPSQVERLRAAPYLSRRDAIVVAGGAERSDSVRAGVAAADAEVVLVHDAARPLVSPALVDAVAAAAAEHGAAVPVMPVADTLRRATGGTVERDGLLHAQTPQGARRQALLDAFAAADGASFTDEATLLEAHGIRVATVPGEPANIKVTEPADLELVRTIAAGRAGEPRIGFGSDSHPFGPGDGLWLGGLLIEEAPALHGHSDGDVVLHALASALLTAGGLGDIGRVFPATEPAHAGAASSGFVSEAVARLAQAGWRPSSVSVGLVGARPRLGSVRLDTMRSAIAGMVGLAEEAVSVSASSGNLSGDEGAGRSISATAVASLVRR
jgi:2-C-methyl-D-erythritol 4-phosphate cytidylyltransferase/2-C-methyl-D-erythritol 2,4-cyclodiphosphate synthase